MLASKIRANPHDIFVSAKTSCAIPVRSEAQRDALVLTTLDPIVRSIGYLATATVEGRTITLDAIVLRRDDGIYSLDVVPSRINRVAHEEHLLETALATLRLPPLTVTMDEILRQPRHANACAIWQYRNMTVPIGLRIAVMQALENEGTMQLAQLVESLPAERDPAPALLAMACADLIEIDILSRPIGPRTMIRSRA
jgi:hypothetical protein